MRRIVSRVTLRDRKARESVFNMGLEQTRVTSSGPRVAVAVHTSPRGFQNRRGDYGRARLWCLGLFLCLCLLMINVWPVTAQTPAPPTSESSADLSIQRLRIQVMPEFDDPRVLVIIQGRLAVPNTAFPLSATFRVPRGAQINQMATMDMATGVTAPQSFDAQPDSKDSRWSFVTYTLNGAHFFYEYYYNPLIGETDKQFTFTFISPQHVEDLLLEVQQPLAATNFTLDPPATVARFDEAMSFTYHQFNIGALAAGEETSVTANYTKTDPEPSLTREEVMAMMGNVPPETPPTVEASRARSTVPTWVFVLGGVILAAAGGYIVWHRAQSGSAFQIPMTPEAKTPEPPQASESPGLCSQCGATLKASARFCHVCGASCEVRLE